MVETDFLNLACRIQPFMKLAEVNAMLKTVGGSVSVNTLGSRDRYLYSDEYILINFF